jgi:hypothetical protein
MTDMDKIDEKNDVTYTTRVDAVEVLGAHDNDGGEDRSAATAENGGIKGEHFKSSSKHLSRGRRLG